MLELATLDIRSKLRWIMVWHWSNWEGPGRAGFVLLSKVQKFWVGDLRHLGGKRVYQCSYYQGNPTIKGYNPPST